MKTTKATKMVLCGAAVALLGMVFVACGTRAPARPAADELVSVPVVGEWHYFDDEDNDGTSTIEMMETEVGGMLAMYFAGEITESFQWGFAGFGIDLDDVTMELVYAAAAVSFMIRGDGQRYTIRLEASNVADYGHFEYSFDTVAGETARITVPIRNFMQPAWALQVGRLRLDLVTAVSWQTHEIWRPGSFELTVWDVNLYVPAGVAASAEVARAVALLAAAEEVENED